jgi:hypothetical protein
MSDPVESVDMPALAEAPPACRRGAVRYAGPAAAPGGSCGTPGEPGRPAAVYNLSATGIGLLVDIPVPAATPLDIDLVTAAAGRVTLRARPVHATRRRDGRWLIGCQLLQPLTPDELQALL